jgi:hypothetical protein
LKEIPMTDSVLLADFPKRARKETEESHDATRLMIEQFALMTTQIQFPVTAITPDAGLLTTTVEINLTDTNDIKMLFGENTAGRVQVDNNGGSAAGIEVSADGETWGTSAVVSFTKGVATVYSRATGTGTHVLTLVDVDVTGLTLGGDATVTYS